MLGVWNKGPPILFSLSEIKVVDIWQGQGRFTEAPNPETRPVVIGFSASQWTQLVTCAEMSSMKCWRPHQWKIWRNIGFFLRSLTSWPTNPFLLSYTTKEPTLSLVFLSKAWSGTNIRFSLFRLTLRIPKHKCPLIFFQNTWRLCHQQIKEFYFVAYIMNHVIMCVTLPSNNGKRSWIPRYNMIL